MSVGSVVLHCNAGVDCGMGHLVRCATLAEEVLGRGGQARIVGDLDARSRTLLASLVPGATAEVVPSAAAAGSLIAAVRDASPDVVHIDSYWHHSDALVGSAPLVSNMQDGPFGVRAADIGIDANLGAAERFAHPELTRRQLAGADFALVRSQVRRLRDAPRPSPAPPSVLVVLGGTDPHGATERVLRGLDAIRSPLTITVIAPAAARRRIEQAAQEVRHEVTVRAFVRDLARLAHEHTLVITAAGTSVWDLACLGMPMALVCVTENQRLGYRAAITAGLGIGFDLSTERNARESARRVSALVQSPARLHRLARIGRGTFDGLGAWRVVSAWEVESDTTSSPHGAADPAALTLRPATATDAAVLFRWRDDARTRAVSRSTAPLVWADHCRWLNDTLSSPDRLLLVAEESGTAVGTSRWDRHDPDDWEISITIAPEMRGRGLGAALVAASERELSQRTAPARMTATVHRDNLPSYRLFVGAGYLPHRPPDVDGFQTLAHGVIPRRGATGAEV